MLYNPPISKSFPWSCSSLAVFVEEEIEEKTAECIRLYSTNDNHKYKSCVAGVFMSGCMIFGY